MILTVEQQAAIDEIVVWFTSSSKREDYMTMGGFAGTGKTTLIHYILNEMPDLRTAVIAFTGKACDVLNNKKIYAQTIHSYLYHAEKHKDGTVDFLLKNSVSEDLVIVDEASMVPKELFDDLMRIGGKFRILFIGDHGQLPPISKRLNLMADPILKLETVHRQAINNPILKLATRVRTGKGDIPMEDFRNDVGYSYNKNLFDCPEAKNDYFYARQNYFRNAFLICSTNRTRCELNKRIRKDIFDDVSDVVQIDDKIIILENNRGLGVFNGMMMNVNQIELDHKEYFQLNGLYPVSKHAFGSIKPKTCYDMKIHTKKQRYRNLVSADYAYCITCHKAQGSQEDVVFIKFSNRDKELWGNDFRRWLYTAVTRAVKRVHIFEDFQ